MDISKLKIVAIILCIALKCTSISAQDFTIKGSWKISFEDKKEFSKAEFNDTAWADLAELTWTDTRKITDNRTLWIRKTVLIPSSLKSEFEKTGVLALSMGKILQSDDTYLNGKLIGATGSGDSYRNYLVNKDAILWDKENKIAIRVRHWGTFKMSKLPNFAAASPNHFLIYGSGLKDGNTKDPILNKDLIYQLSVVNKSPKSVDGIVKADFYNFEGTKIHTIEKNVRLSAGNNAIEFPYHSTVPFLKIVYAVSIPNYQYSSEWNGEFGYENVTYKAVLPVIAYKAPQKFYPADLSKLKIGGWLGEKLKANTEKRLYKVDEDAILAGFINRPGSHSWIGEHVGKFLEAACNAYANNADPALKIQIDRSAQQLIAAQLSDGYLGTYEMDSHWTSWDVWSHRYDLMGLLRYYELSGFKPALTASQRVGDLLIKTFGTEKGQKNIVKAGGHVGMAATCILESMGELYRFSGDKKYLDYCYFLIKSFDTPGGPHIISTLNTVGRVDKVANAKAYEMLSNLLGVVKLYRITNDEQFLKPAITAWNDIVSKRLYITGTTSSYEHFQDDGVLPANNDAHMGEGCVTTTWVQFNYQLWCITGDMKYLNELERSVYNHLIGAENPQTGCVSYYTPLVGKKPYGCAITCCMSSVPRGIALIPQFVNGKMGGNPAFLFYQQGVYTTQIGDKNIVSFNTTSDFLADNKIDIEVNPSNKSRFTLAFRKPYWANDFALYINNVLQKPQTGDLVLVNRVWKKQDKISIKWSLPLKILDGGISYPNALSFQRGPQVLVFDQSLQKEEAAKVTINQNNIPITIAKNALPKGWIGAQSYQLPAKIAGVEGSVILVPYADAGQTGGIVETWLKKGQ